MDLWKRRAARISGTTLPHYSMIALFFVLSARSWYDH